MQVLKYRGLDPTSVLKQYEKIIYMLEQNDFYSAEVKKLQGTPYYRAKLDHSNRLLFTLISYQEHFVNPNFAKQKLTAIYNLLNPREINLHINNQLVKLGDQHMEFFLVNAMIVMMIPKDQYIAAFKVDHFLLPLQNFPNDSNIQYFIVHCLR